MMFHRRQKSTHPKDIKCTVCSKMFSSLSCLSCHKKLEKHNKRSLSGNRNEAAKFKKGKKNNQRSINDMLRQAKAINHEERSDEEEEKECAAAECVIHFLENVVIIWVSCEICEEWFHSNCVPSLRDKSEDEIKD